MHPNTIKELNVSDLPDGTKLKTFLIMNSVGHRIGKVSGNLEDTTRDELYDRAVFESNKIKARFGGSGDSDPK